MPDNIYALILAGGKGERFWPASRINYPKHLLKMWGKKSLLQQTLSRLKTFIPVQHIFIITTQEQITLVKKQIPQIRTENLIIEPMSRNTAAAIGLACMLLNTQDGETIIVVVPSDHHIGAKDNFVRTIEEAAGVARKKKVIVTLGIKPTYPATGYGYIKTVVRQVYHPERSRGTYRKDKFYKVEKFIEKPDLRLAQKFVKTKSYFWNSGIFIFSSSVMLENIKKYQPKLYTSLLKIKKTYLPCLSGRQATEEIYPKGNMPKIYSQLDNISIDYAIMEKTSQLYMMEAKFSWDDVGSWGSLERYLPRDNYKNVISAIHKGIDTQNCIVVGQPNHLVSTIGLKDMLIVQTKTATLICPKNRLENIKKLVNSLAVDKNYKQYLSY